MDTEALYRIAQKEGHSLEQRVDDIFRNHGFISEQNYSLKNSDDLDVFAYSNISTRYNSIFIIECNGTNVVDIYYDHFSICVTVCHKLKNQLFYPTFNSIFL